MESQFSNWQGSNTTAFQVVEMFEKRVAEFAGAKYAIAVATGTWAIFLAARLRHEAGYTKVTIPAQTFISVPMALIQAGLTIRFREASWTGIYEIFPLGVHDGALRWCRGMYRSGLHCLSFHARKSLPIGEGGMILTDYKDDAEQLRMMRYSGRKAPLYRVEDVTAMGWQAYMTPEKAARGLHLMEYTHDEPDQIVHYEDLRKAPYFQQTKG